MGNSDIRDFAHIEEVEMPEIAGCSVSVDASNWLYKYMTTTARFTRTDAYTNNDGIELTNLIGVPRGIRKFFQNNIQPIFVFDGKPHNLKSKEVERRKSKRSEAAQKAKESSDSVEKSKYESRSQQLSNDVITTTKKLLDLLDVPYMTAPQSAESQAAYMTNNSNDIDRMISDDYDSLIFGSNITIRKFTTSSNNLEIMSLDKTLEKLDITHDQLIMATILCGTDYNDGVDGIGPKTAIDIVRGNTTITGLKTEVDEEIQRLRPVFEIYNTPKVSDNWPNTKISNPNISEVREYLNSQGIDISEVEKALNDIEESSSQTGLNSF
jgi:flap endonuclease-1